MSKEISAGCPIFCGKIKSHHALCMLALALVLSACNKSVEPVESVKTIAPTKWEYEELHWTADHDREEWGYDNVQAYLNCLIDGRWESNRVYSRSDTLTHLGEMGWEVVWGSASGDNFLLKRPYGPGGEFTFQVNIDYEKHEKEFQAKMEEERKQTTALLSDSSGSDSYDQLLASNAVLEAQLHAEAKAAEERRVKDGQAKTIKWLQELAATNDAYGELRLGERYLKGDGVEKDEAKARQLLERSAAQGDKDAAELLRQLSSK